MYKLFISDLDDTLLDPQKRWPRGFDAFRQVLQKKQIEFTLATGRSGQAVQAVVDHLNLRIPYVTSNGANIMRDGKVIKSFAVPIGPLESLIKKALDQEMAIIYVVDGVEYALATHPFFTGSEKQNFTHQKIRPLSQNDYQQLNIEKLLLIDDHPDTGLDRLFKLTDDLDSAYTSFTYSDWAMDIVGTKVNKGSALKWLADYFNLEMEQVIAAGDNHNDVPLLEAAGYSIAAKNSIKTLQELADVTASQSHGLGVIQEVLKIID